MKFYLAVFFMATVAFRFHQTPLTPCSNINQGNHRFKQTKNRNLQPDILARSWEVKNYKRHRRSQVTTDNVYPSR